MTRWVIRIWHYQKLSPIRTHIETKMVNSSLEFIKSVYKFKFFKFLETSSHLCYRFLSKMPCTFQKYSLSLYVPASIKPCICTTNLSQERMLFHAISLTLSILLNGDLPHRDCNWLAAMCKMRKFHFKFILDEIKTGWKCPMLCGDRGQTKGEWNQHSVFWKTKSETAQSENICHFTVLFGGYLP